MSGDISKQDLYESVKTIIETEHKHILLNQHKLYTLFSIAFQSILFLSTKDPGAYIIRIEDAKLADKFARKAKDPSTRKFIQSLLMPRKFKFQKSMFYLDFFNFQSWNLTAEIPPEKLKGAIIVKDSAEKPPMNPMLEQAMEEEDALMGIPEMPKDYHLTTLLGACPKTITIAYETEFDEMVPVQFPFIKKEITKTVSGVTLGKDFDWDNIED
ncbi:hypothetical protein [Bacteriovorax sp. Seq25_V]|uniref:hypothetical protein n=1 Tax=Bacteriovorax sp. Seq25_V TaxID=1201288 RepID=UPI000389EF34|nr:hypothetical protein [Bacteriovorax sp. Seq25_V]EQC48047.1 hypothetical protein M900_1129 [Bacteriovorax sp. Seq25_V]